MKRHKLTTALFFWPMCFTATAVNADDETRFIEQAAVRDTTPNTAKDMAENINVIDQSQHDTFVAPSEDDVRNITQDLPDDTPVIVDQSGNGNRLQQSHPVDAVGMRAHTLAVVFQDGQGNETAHSQLGTRNALSRIQDGRRHGDWRVTNGWSGNPFAFDRGVYDASLAGFRPPHGSAESRQGYSKASKELTADLAVSGALNYTTTEQYGMNQTVRGRWLPQQAFRQAGMANVIKIQQGRKQMSHAGNRITGSQVGLSNASFVLQDGSYNHTQINQRFTQRSTTQVLQKRIGNTASIRQSRGHSNETVVRQMGSDNDVEIVQSGSFNTAQGTQN